jgi:hypothetical protein
MVRRLLLTSFFYGIVFAVLFSSSVSFKTVAEDGWITLFDGTSLENWKASENKSTFKLEDGIIVCNGKRSHLFYMGNVSNANFKNFELKVDVKTKPNSNGGIYFHTEYQETGWPSKGFEVQVNNTFVRDPRKTGSLYRIQDIKEAIPQDDEWFTEHITVKGRRVIIRVNDVALVDYFEPDPPQPPDGMEGRILSSGTFALQGHDPGSTVYYKNIRVKPLPEDTDWISLFNGKNLDGWTQRNGTATYRVENGTILGKTAEGSPNSFLCSNSDYSDFELEFEVKCDDRLNSGVQIRSKTKDLDPQGRVYGPQVEIEASPGEAGYVYGEATGRGWLIPQDQLIPHSNYKNGQWNKYRIFATGSRFQTWINGVRISDLVDDPIYETHASGFIGLQVHGIKEGTGPYEVAWRNIRIREIY